MALISTQECKKPPPTPVLILTHKGVDTILYSLGAKGWPRHKLLAQTASLPVNSGGSSPSGGLSTQRGNGST